VWQIDQRDFPERLVAFCSAGKDGMQWYFKLLHYLSITKPLKQLSLILVFSKSLLNFVLHSFKNSRVESECNDRISLFYITSVLNARMSSSFTKSYLTWLDLKVSVTVGNHAWNWDWIEWVWQWKRVGPKLGRFGYVERKGRPTMVRYRNRHGGRVKDGRMLSKMTFSLRSATRG